MLLGRIDTELNENTSEWYYFPNVVALTSSLREKIDDCWTLTSQYIQQKGFMHTFDHKFISWISLPNTNTTLGNIILIGTSILFLPLLHSWAGDSLTDMILTGSVTGLLCYSCIKKAYEEIAITNRKIAINNMSEDEFELWIKEKSKCEVQKVDTDAYDLIIDKDKYVIIDPKKSLGKAV